MTTRSWYDQPEGIAYPRPINDGAGKLLPLPIGSGPYRSADPVASERAKPRLPVIGAGGLRSHVAPWPQIERYPIITGRNLTLEVLSQRFRLCLTGYRQLYVDVLNELIERDPSAFAVMQKRVLAVANAKLRVVPARLPADAPEADQKRAREIADAFETDTLKIPRLRSHLAMLAWADYYALQAAEMLWIDDPYTGRMRIGELSMIHSRRLSYPDPWRWDLYVWDQGAVLGSPRGGLNVPPGVFGWRIADYPGKFIVHAPQVRGDYPVREGLGREIAYWMVLKHIAARAAPQYLERFSNPPQDITWRTSKKDGEVGRPASDEDIASAEAAAALDVILKWAHPDTVKWDIKSPDGVGGRAKVTFDVWMQVCDDQITKAVLGSTLGTDVDGSGSRALGDTQRKDTLTLFSFAAQSLADSLNESYTPTWCVLNYPDDGALWPTIALMVEDDPDPNDVMERIAKATIAGMPVDADKAAEMVGLPVVDPEDQDARVLRPVSPTPPTAPPYAPAVFGNDEEAAQERQKQAMEIAAQQQALAPAKPGEPAAKKAEPSEEKPKPEEKPKTLTFAQRNAAFLADLKDMRDVGLELTDTTIALLAREHGVPAPTLRRTTAPKKDG